MNSAKVSCLGVIPVRLESSRFPNKPLKMINGKTLVERVWHQASKSKRVTTLVVATNNREIAEECDAAIASGVPLMGVCIYPLIDMTEWHAGHWMRIGAWEVDNEGGSLVRRPYAPLVAELVRRVRTPNASRPRLDQLLDSSKPIA
ncbi:MAG: hypothetical protein EBS89_13365 [Proteobacteria bacterium]|nr:hypothetical protein [Pseudomonadota bacterium]